MITHSPVVSIITPCYNSTKYVHETLSSLSAQTFTDFEIIAMDDGSSDDTLAILQAYAQHEPRLKIYTQSNQGQAGARQNAIAHATGEYLLCVDSDDKLSPNALEKFVQAARTHQADIVSSNHQLFGRKGTSIIHMSFNLKRLLWVNCILMTALLRRDKFIAAGGFDANLRCFEDWELWINLIKHGAKVHHIPEVLFFYRQREDLTSVTDTTTQYENEATAYIYNKHRQFYSEQGINLYYVFHDAYSCYEKKRSHYANPLRRWFYKTFKPKKYQQIYARYDLL